MKIMYQQPNWAEYADRVIKTNGYPSTKDAEDCGISFETWLKASNLGAEAYLDWAKLVKSKLKK